jgi:hypothetical protein
VLIARGSKPSGRQESRFRLAPTNGRGSPACTLTS